MGIRIEGSGDDFASTVDVGCDLLKQEVRIELHVVDEKGNYNTAWTNLFLEDKIAPICTAPAPRTRFCDEFHNGELGAPAAEWTDTPADLIEVHNTYFGEFTCEDNLAAEVCGDLRTQEQYRLREWPCGEIELDRRHRARDWSDNYSAYVTQFNTVEYRAGWSFTVPGDWEGECGSTAPAADITIDNGACDLLGYEVTEKQFDVPGDACFKIERTCLLYTSDAADE